MGWDGKGWDGEENRVTDSTVHDVGVCVSLLIVPSEEKARSEAKYKKEIYRNPTYT